MTDPSDQGGARSRTWWIAFLFIVGSTLLGLGAMPSSRKQPGYGPPPVTFFIGSLFFTSAAFLQYRESVATFRLSKMPQGRRFWVRAPRNIDWLACAVQFAGTLWFNWSTGNAVRNMTRPPRTRGYGGRRGWAPSRSSWPAGSPGWTPAAKSSTEEPRPRVWWIAVANLLGSIAFGVSAVAGYVVPASDDVWNAEVSNLGTLVGAICFLIGAILLLRHGP